MSLANKTVRRSSVFGSAAALLIGFIGWLTIQWPHSGLWYDEALTAYVATDSWQTLWRWCTQVDIQVPFHYVVLRLWAGLVGDSEFCLRLLSVFCAIMAVAGMVAIGRRDAAGTRVRAESRGFLRAPPRTMWDP